MTALQRGDVGLVARFRVVFSGAGRNRFRPHRFLRAVLQRLEPDVHSGTVETSNAEVEPLEDMPRFFFHTSDGVGFHDQNGTVLEDAEAASIEAARLLGQLIDDHPDEVWGENPLHMAVTDEDGLVLYTLDISALRATATGGFTNKRSQPGSQ